MQPSALSQQSTAPCSTTNYKNRSINKTKRVKQREICTHRYIFRALWTRSSPREDSNPCLSPSVRPSLTSLVDGGSGGGAVGARVLVVPVRVRDAC